jgi:hypothetical protein
MALSPPVAELRSNRIVLLGSFNPRILQPAWLAAQNLIREAESENAEITIIHEEATVFSIDWATIEVERERLRLATTTKSETPEQLRDLAIGILETLDHTPIHVVAIQSAAHYPMASQERRDALGWKLVPPGPFEGEISRPGMAALHVNGARSGEDWQGSKPPASGLVTVSVEPSSPLAPHGVFIQVDDRYPVADPEAANTGTGPAVACIKENWETSLKRAERIVEGVFTSI